MFIIHPVEIFVGGLTEIQLALSFFSNQTSFVDTL